MYCISCGKPLNPGARFCNACGAAQNTGATPTPGEQQNLQIQQQFQKPPGNQQKDIKPWISLILSFVSAIFYLILGGDAFTREVNIFDWLTIPTSIAAIVTAVKFIPASRKALMVISIIIAVFFLIASLSWVFLQ